MSAPAVTKRAIRTHYELATPFYRLLWGPHIHHGLWDADEPPAQAQRRLIERLAAEAAVPDGARVLDVGCGMGGSSVHLAQRHGCHVTGLTLSRVQRLWATWAAWTGGVGGQVRVHCLDAEKAAFPPASFDVLWSVECTEHLFDKPGFFRRAAAWVRPGGRVALGVWLAADRPHDAGVAAQVDAVCRHFLCPSLGTAGDYLDWLDHAGFTEGRCIDLTDRVTRTWEICRRRVRASGLRWLARCAGSDMTAFVEHFDTILRAYQSGAMRYGLVTARAPGSFAST